MTPTIAEVDTLLRTTFAASDSARICDLIGEMLARLDPDTQVIVTRGRSRSHRRGAPGRS